jgi:SNF family Na+-dependent transporter
MASEKIKDGWGSRIGVIAAVAGSAVGLGNFLRFPGQAAQFGGGAFMLAYAISFLIIGLPIGWAEWAMGRFAGQRGYNSAPGIFHSLVKHGWSKYVGVLGVIIPVVIFMYYVVIEAWTLGYTVRFIRGLFDPSLRFDTVEASKSFFGTFVGIEQDGAALKMSWDAVLPWLLLVTVLNLVLIYRGISRGIEKVCQFAMPVLIVLAVAILVRVLTLGAPVADQPQNNVSQGLGYMWNPTKVKVIETAEDGSTMVIQEFVGPEAEQEAAALAAGDPNQEVVVLSAWQQLSNPDLWLAAAGQIFFSLSVGFGVILVYASYMSRRDDVVLSGLTASSTNELCEVGLGGLITLPAGVAFLGVAGVAGMGTFGLGFNVLPLVFSAMPGEGIFGAVFFFMLFLAALTSSLSMLQPGIALLEESLNIGRRASVAMLGLITAFGSGFVVYFSAGLKALDTIDFWVGSFLIFVLATFQIILFGWVFGVDRGWRELHHGSVLSIPSIFKLVFKFVCPAFLLTIFSMWVAKNIFGVDFSTGASGVSSYVKDLVEDGNVVAWLSVSLIAAVGIAIAVLVSISPAYKKPVEEAETP